MYDRNDAFLKRLRKQGAIVGKNVQIVDRYKLLYEPWYANLIEIQDGVIIAAGVRLVCHDSSYANIAGDLPVKFGKIIIEKKSYIGVNSIILPGVRIGEGSLVGAGSVVNKDIPPYCVAAGNPARVISTIEEGLARYKESMNANDQKGVYYLDFGGSYEQVYEKWGKDVNNAILKKYSEYKSSGYFD